jgi:hypothetical protein
MRSVDCYSLVSSSSKVQDAVKRKYQRYSSSDSSATNSKDPQSNKKRQPVQSTGTNCTKVLIMNECLLIIGSYNACAVAK